MLKYKIETAKKILKEKGLGRLFIAFFNYFVYSPIRYILNLIESTTILFKSKKFFLFQEKKLPYFYHRHNSTWKNERIVEIPIILKYLKESPEIRKRVLEFGAVLKHYYSVKRNILDKYERGKGIINEDVVTFKPSEKYDFIISISTLEHVGFDEEDKDPNKIIRAMENLRKNCLEPGGKGVFTMPLGYNPHMDKLLFNNKLKFDEEIYLKRTNKENEWKETSKREAKNIKYGEPFNAANSIIVGIIKN